MFGADALFRDNAKTSPRPGGICASFTTTGWRSRGCRWIASSRFLTALDFLLPARSSARTEQRPSKPWVAGSNPAGQANSRERFARAHSRFGTERVRTRRRSGRKHATHRAAAKPTRQAAGPPAANRRVRPPLILPGRPFSLRSFRKSRTAPSAPRPSHRLQRLDAIQVFADGWTTLKPSSRSNGSKSRSQYRSEWLSRRQNVAMRQSMVLRTVRPCARRMR